MKSMSFEHERAFFLALDPGDEAVEALRRFAVENAIRAGWFDAIGAFSEATVAFWNKDTKEYERIPVAEQVEVLSLSGDVGIDGGEVRIHAHAVLGRRDGSTMGGHLMSGRVYPTLEVHLVTASGALPRRKHRETGLSLVAIE
jgi:predicted DNA-binding protein with PD1-like motif